PSGGRAGFVVRFAAMSELPHAPALPRERYQSSRPDGNPAIRPGFAAALQRRGARMFLQAFHILTETSLPGLTRQSIFLKKMDARIKSAHDA
ncbi:MAG: hypothetical protein WBA29_18980, partial [Xanthobacteraceae bacterium]